MSSLILRTATRLLEPLLLFFSVFVLLRGHNEPGGGFAGGLVAAAALALYTITFDVQSARSALRIDPHTMIGMGLLLAASSGGISLLQGRPFLTVQWIALHLPGVGEVALGTALLFDTGVYMVVLGVTLLIIWSLAEE